MNPNENKQKTVQFLREKVLFALYEVLIANNKEERKSYQEFLHRPTIASLESDRLNYYTDGATQEEKDKYRLIYPSFKRLFMHTDTDWLSAFSVLLEGTPNFKYFEYYLYLTLRIAKLNESSISNSYFMSPLTLWKVVVKATSEVSYYLIIKHKKPNYPLVLSSSSSGFHEVLLNFREDEEWSIAEDDEVQKYLQTINTMQFKTIVTDDVFAPIIVNVFDIE